MLRSALGDPDVIGRRLATVAVGGAGAAWIGVTAWLARNESAAAAVPIGCPFKALTGLDCPGCGSTRSLGALTRLDLGAALDHHLLVPVTLVFLLASFVSWTVAAWCRGGRRDVDPQARFAATDLVRRPGVIVSILVLVVAFGIVRNLEIGSWLASGLST